MSQAASYRSGFVALVGRPNVGKSTLLNRLLGGKVAIISDKPQTTRTRILGVKHLPGAQMVFLDTPGIHKPKFRLNQRMVDVALHVLDEVDLAFFLVEATEAPGPGDRFVLERLKERKLPVFLVVNKIDLVKKLRLLPLLDEYQRMHEFAEIVPISAKTGDGVDRLVDLTLARMPEGPVYFPEDVMTDQPMRILAAEIIREKLLQKTRDELPFAVAVGGGRHLCPHRHGESFRYEGVPAALGEGERGLAPRRANARRTRILSACSSNWDIKNGSDG